MEQPVTPKFTDTLGDHIMKFLGWRDNVDPAVPVIGEPKRRVREYMNVNGTNPDGTENPNDLYLRRYYIYRGKRRPHIYLHHIIRSDYERACHDHPWDFTSVILWGGYTEYEQCLDTAFCAAHTHKTYHRPGTIIRHNCTDLHRLELPRPAWTLVFTGPRKRDWGFQTPDKGWIKWNTLYQYIKDMMS